MIGYIFISSGALSTKHPEKYPARLQQIRNLKFVFLACGEDSPEVQIEKAARVESLDSLPNLKSLLVQAARKRDRVLIDDFRRIFYRVPLRRRKDMIEELVPFAPVFWEARRGGRSLGSALKHDLEALVTIARPVRTVVPPEDETKPSQLKSIKLRRIQTRNARDASAKSRKRQADFLARYLTKIRAALQEEGKPTTLQAVADAANERGLKTARGGNWSAATVKRMLDRAKDLEPEN